MSIEEFLLFLCGSYTNKMFAANRLFKSSKRYVMIFRTQYVRLRYKGMFTYKQMFAGKLVGQKNRFLYFFHGMPLRDSGPGSITRSHKGSITMCVRLLPHTHTYIYIYIYI